MNQQHFLSKLQEGWPKQGPNAQMLEAHKQRMAPFESTQVPQATSYLEKTSPLKTGHTAKMVTMKRQSSRGTNRNQPVKQFREHDPDSAQESAHFGTYLST